MPTTHVIDWKSNAEANKPPLTVITDPESIYTGDKIKISLYSAFQHDLISPYGGLGSKTVADINPQQDEIIELSGSGDIAAKFPIASVITMVAAIPLVDEVSRSIVLEAGLPLGGLVQVVNQQLKITNQELKLHGSIRVVYNTFFAQKWTHKAFAKKGQSLLFAHNLGTGDYENVQLSINEKGQTERDTSIKIDFYPTQKFGYAPYAHFIVFPARKDPIVKTNVGNVEKLRTEQRKIERESISFSGDDANASFFIDELIEFTGYFFDGKGDVIEPTFRMSDGGLKANIECFGTGYLTYKTTGIVYAYNADTSKKDSVSGSIRVSQTNIVIGSIFAFDRNKRGIAATYEIPRIEFAVTEPVDFATVYRKILIQPAGSYEYPPNWSNDDNTFPSISAGSGLPEVGESTLEQKQVHVVVKLFGDESIDKDNHLVRWLDPYSGTANLDVEFHIDESIPDSATQDAKDRMQSVIDDLKKEYGITS